MLCIISGCLYAGVDVVCVSLQVCVCACMCASMCVRVCVRAGVMCVPVNTGVVVELVCATSTFSYMRSLQGGGLWQKLLDT